MKATGKPKNKAGKMTSAHPDSWLEYNGSLSLNSIAFPPFNVSGA